MSVFSCLYIPIELFLCEEFFELKVLHGHQEVLILPAVCFHCWYYSWVVEEMEVHLINLFFLCLLCQLIFPCGFSWALLDTAQCRFPSILTSWEEFASLSIQVDNRTSKGLIASMILLNISKWTNRKVSNTWEALLQRFFFWLEFCWKLSLLLRNRNLLFFKSECP